MKSHSCEPESERMLKERFFEKKKQKPIKKRQKGCVRQVFLASWHHHWVLESETSETHASERLRTNSPLWMRSPTWALCGALADCLFSHVSFMQVVQFLWTWNCCLCSIHFRKKKLVLNCAIEPAALSFTHMWVNCCKGTSSKNPLQPVRLHGPDIIKQWLWISMAEPGAVQILTHNRECWYRPAQEGFSSYWEYSGQDGKFGQKKICNFLSSVRLTRLCVERNERNVQSQTDERQKTSQIQFVPGLSGFSVPQSKSASFACSLLLPNQDYSPKQQD